MARFALLFRKPIHEIAQWPAWELDLIEEFDLREPDVLSRIEFILAQFSAIYVNKHSKQGHGNMTASDFMPHLKSWPEQNDSRYSNVDMEILKEFM